MIHCLLSGSHVDTPDHHDVQFLDDRLYEYNVAGLTARMADCSRSSFVTVTTTLLRDSMAGPRGSCCEVKTLWVHEQSRGQGLGTRLMTAAEARSPHARGSPNGVVDA